ncbi:MAG TPA: glycosyltransferase [Verrucomicrobiae bacterium]|nr:glycosyltransferase [Verrucomicrobiae bacterium]
MKPLVSILIPAYNAERWIDQAIQSAIAQTWPHKEIIVVDDGSSDRTLCIADEFSKHGVNVLFQPHQSASTARNRAFSACKGDYIQWLDADDVLAPDKISRQMEFAEHCGNKRLLLSSEWGRFHFRTSRAQFIPNALWDDLSPVEWLVRKLGRNIWMQPGTWLVSRELTEAAGPWDERLSFDDDGEYFCRVLLESDGVKFIRDARVFYRATGPTSLSVPDDTNKKMESGWLSIRLHIQYLRWLEDSRRTREACLTYLQTWLPMFYPHRPDIIREVQRLAEILGGKTEVFETIDPLRWKFAWMKNIFGLKAAYRAQIALPRMKHAAIRFWDKTMFEMEQFARI